MKKCRRCGTMFQPTCNRNVYCQGGCALEVRRELDRESHNLRSAVKRETRPKRTRGFPCTIPISIGEPMKGRVVGDPKLIDGEWCYPVVLYSAARRGDKQPDWYPKGMVVQVEDEWA